ncbi:MAG: hypothetical protein WD205_09835, partial [Rhodothermales bacterium]
DSLSISGPSLSPDGRWVAFTHYEGDESEIWMVSADGGEPFSVTSGGGFCDGVVWFPEGDRIAYRCGHLLSQAIDPSTGQPRGDPQRITLEGSNAYFDISPDGRWIAFTPMDDNGQRVIQVVPSNGGVPHTIVEESTTRPLFAPDGASLYYRRTRTDSPEETLVRIRVEEGERARGAEPEEIFTTHASVWLASGYVLLEMDPDAARPPLMITDLEGHPLGRVSLEEGMNPFALSADGRTILAYRREHTSPLRIAPVGGGRPRTLQEAGSTPLNWTPDGRHLLTRTKLDGTERLFLADIEQGTMEEVVIPDSLLDPPFQYSLDQLPRPLLSTDGQHLLYAVPGATPQLATLKILDMGSDSSSVVTTQYAVPGAFMLERATGPGGTSNRDDDEFFFWERYGEGLSLKAVRPRGESRSLKVFDNPESPISVAVFGDRIAYLEHEGAKATIFFAEAGSSSATPVLTVEGFLDALSWSWDGRWLAASHWAPDGSNGRVMLAKVSESGHIEGEPRYVGPVSISWWGHQWLPDSSGFLTAGTEGDVWFIPVDPALEPVPVTESEGLIYDFVLSPDGRQIAYSPWIPEGSSLWLIDLGDALARSSR